MRAKRCGICGEWIFWDERTETDIVHSCVKSDGTALQKRDERYHPNQTTLNMDNKDWPRFGVNFQGPMRINPDKIHDQLHDLTDVKVVVEVD